MTRRKIDTRPIEVRRREAYVRVEVLTEELLRARAVLANLDATAGVIRDLYPVKTSGDGGI